MMLAPYIISIIALIFLYQFSKKDWEESKVENRILLPFLLIGVVFALINGAFIVGLISMILMGVVTYIMWNKEVIGAADVKILTILPLYFGLSGFPQTIVGLFFFFVLFLVIGIVYSFVMKIIFKSRDKIPFVPAIAITYIIFIVFRYFWLKV